MPSSRPASQHALISQLLLLQARHISTFDDCEASPLPAITIHTSTCFFSSPIGSSRAPRVSAPRLSLSALLQTHPPCPPFSPPQIISTRSPRPHSASAPGLRSGACSSTRQSKQRLRPQPYPVVGQTSVLEGGIDESFDASRLVNSSDCTPPSAPSCSHSTSSSQRLTTAVQQPPILKVDIHHTSTSCSR